MTNNAAINYHDPFAVRRLGMDALKEKLGTVGAVYFLRQFNSGSRDYTRDREKIFAGYTFDEIVKGSMEMDEKWEKEHQA
jgi:hypothetical protein